MKNKMKEQISIKLYKLVLIFIFIILISVFTTVLFVSRGNTNNINVIKSNKLDEASYKFVKAYNIIKDGYYKDVDLDKGIDGAINGLLETLNDPHTSYFSRESKDQFYDVMNGSYKGIGAEISENNDNEVIVLSVFKNSPGAKIGLQTNDVILEVNGVSIKGKTPSEAVTLIKDPDKENALIKIRRDSKELEFDIVKEIITLDSVESNIYKSNNKKIGYVSVNIFADNTYSQFKSAVEELEEKNIDSLIIDVRNNSGGYLYSVTDMLNMFFKKGEVVYQIADKTVTTKFKDSTSENRTYEIAVLINESSASASEILAVAFKEAYNAKIIGATSYGKGTVQATYDFSDGAMIKYTIQKWLSPKGNWINKIGVTPTIEVKQSSKYAKSQVFENDTQLKKAIEELSKD
ncbi:MAG TPA: S41 family peptidase [Bacilli bacterium]|nr:S41 family peptidase [Bacilli bacterium]